MTGSEVSLHHCHALDDDAGRSDCGGVGHDGWRSGAPGTDHALGTCGGPLLLCPLKSDSVGGPSAVLEYVDGIGFASSWQVVSSSESSHPRLALIHRTSNPWADPVPGKDFLHVEGPSPLLSLYLPRAAGFARASEAL